MKQYRIEHNAEFDSNEIYFDAVPEKQVRENLKAIGCRWHKVKKCWYTRKNEEQIRTAIEGQKTEDETINEYGVKVGDVFLLSWGYDQTNNNFFQVVSVTKKKARIVEVTPSYTTEWAAGMAEDRRLTYTEGETLPRAARSFWIKDNENGDLKSIVDYSQDKTHPEVIIESGRYWVFRCSPGTTFYESWYA